MESCGQNEAKAMSSGQLLYDADFQDVSAFVFYQRAPPRRAQGMSGFRILMEESADEVQ